MNTEYRVITGYTPEMLAFRVNEAMEDGWQAQGGLSVHEYPKSSPGPGYSIATLLIGDVPVTHVYCQAMVRYAEED